MVPSIGLDHFLLLNGYKKVKTKCVAFEQHFKIIVQSKHLWQLTKSGTISFGKWSEEMSSRK